MRDEGGVSTLRTGQFDRGDDQVSRLVIQGCFPMNGAIDHLLTLSYTRLIG